MFFPKKTETQVCQASNKKSVQAILNAFLLIPFLFQRRNKTLNWIIVLLAIAYRLTDFHPS